MSLAVAVLAAGALLVEIHPNAVLYADDNRTFPLAITVSRDGDCEGGFEVALTATSGKVVQVREVAPGFFEARWQPKAPGDVTFTATARAKQTEMTATAKATVGAYPVATLAIEAVGGIPILKAGAQVMLAVTSTNPSLLTTAPTFETTAGKVTGIKRTSDGKWTAVLQAPAKRFPQIALVGVSAPDRPDIPAAFIAIPWAARVQLPLSTEAGSKVTASAAGRTVGPVTADDRGRVQFNMPIPPGVGEVKLTSVDKLGNTTRSTHELGTPPFKRFLMVTRVLGGGTRADGQADVLLEGHGVKKRGAVADGTMSVTWKAGAGKVALGTPLVVNLRGTNTRFAAQAPGIGRHEATVALKPAPVVDVALESDPASIVVGGRTSATVSAWPRDANKRRRKANAAPALTVTGAKLGPVVKRGGRVSVPLTAPADKIPDGGVATLRARLSESGNPYCAPTRTLDVRIDAGPPANIGFVDVPELPVVSGARSEVVVEVTDSGGNPVEKADLVAVGEPLTVQQVVPQGRGRYRVRVAAPVVNEPTIAGLVVTAGKATGRTELQLSPRPKRISISARPTFEWNYDALYGPGIEIEGQQQLPWHPRLSAAAVLGTSFTNADDSAIPVTGNLWNGAFKLHARWRLTREDARFELQLVAGPEFRAVSSALSLAEGDQGVLNIGVGGGGGIDVAWRVFGNGALTSQLAGSWVPIQERRSPNLVGVTGNAGRLTIGVGYRHGF